MDTLRIRRGCIHPEHGGRGDVLEVLGDDGTPQCAYRPAPGTVWTIPGTRDRVWGVLESTGS
jgi:hypothetical protein